jgi:hypothetical protein
MGRCLHPSPCCGRRGIHVRCGPAGTFHQRCAKCDKPFSYTIPFFAQQAREGARREQLDMRLRRMRALPWEYQQKLIASLDRMTDCYAKVAGVELPELETQQCTVQGNVIQFPGPRQ